MRELNECKAEIFRLSEKRIKERKKARNRILALCIPLCIVAVILSVVVIPAVMPTKEANDEAQLENVADNSNGSYVCSYTRVIISKEKGDYVREITDKAQVTQMFELIFSVKNESACGSGAVDETFVISDGSGTFYENSATADKNEDKKENASVFSVYTITFVDAYGTKTIYKLTGNELLDIYAGNVTVLSAEQLEELSNYF